jgi:hypothetical protein
MRIAAFRHCVDIPGRHIDCCAVVSDEEFALSKIASSSGRIPKRELVRGPSVFPLSRERQYQTIIQRVLYATPSISIALGMCTLKNAAKSTPYVCEL